MDQARVEKIEKLLRKAERAGTPEESETFYAKAHELMAKWAIDEAMINSVKGVKATVVKKAIVINKSGLWRQKMFLLNALCRPNGVKTVYIEPTLKGSKPIVYLIGIETDVANVEMMYLSMLTQESRFRRELMPEYAKAVNSARVAWTKSFIEGFASRVEERLMEVKRMAEQTSAVEYGGSMLPVLASKDDLVAAEMRKLFPHLKMGKAAGGRRDFEGNAAGRSAANRTDIGNKRVGTQKALGK